MTDLSIILPFYKRAAEFAKALKTNYRYFDRSLEIVLVVDEPESEWPLAEIMCRYPNVRWRALINRQDHPWRNPAKAINVGIRNASAPIVFVSSPETVWLTDVPHQLLTETRKRPASFHSGHLLFADTDKVNSLEAFRAKAVTESHNCGSICVLKEHLEQVNGYDESLIGWGGDDDNLRSRLRLTGVHGQVHPHVALVHPPMTGGHRVYSQDTAARLREIVRPTEAKANQDTDWGRDFSEVFYEA